MTQHKADSAAATIPRQKGLKTMTALFIEGRRNGYEPDQCGRTMTVGDLIEYLSQFDEDAQVYLKNDGGYTFGSIDERSFEEASSEDEESEDEEE